MQLLAKRTFLRRVLNTKFEKRGAVKRKKKDYCIQLIVALVNNSLNTVENDSNNSILLCRCSSCVVFLIASKVSHQLIISQN